MKDFVVISDYVVDINDRSINICIYLLRFVCVDGDAAVNMPNNNNTGCKYNNNNKHILYYLCHR